MKTEKFLEDTERLLTNIAPDNLIAAVIKLLEVLHAHGLDSEAVTALSDCGITLEITEG